MGHSLKVTAGLTTSTEEFFRSQFELVSWTPSTGESIAVHRDIWRSVLYISRHVAPRRRFQTVKYPFKMVAFECIWSTEQARFFIFIFIFCVHLAVVWGGAMHIISPDAHQLCMLLATVKPLWGENVYFPTSLKKVIIYKSINAIKVDKHLNTLHDICIFTFVLTVYLSTGNNRSFRSTEHILSVSSDHKWETQRSGHIH